MHGANLEPTEILDLDQPAISSHVLHPTGPRHRHWLPISTHAVVEWAVSYQYKYVPCCSFIKSDNKTTLAQESYPDIATTVSGMSSTLAQYMLLECLFNLQELQKSAQL